MVLKNYLIILLILLLTNCTKTAAIDIVSAPVDIQLTKPNPPATLSLNNITWKILEVDGLIFYAVSINDYQILAQNLLELKRYIQEQQGIIRYYETVTK